MCTWKVAGQEKKAPVLPALPGRGLEPVRQGHQRLRRAAAGPLPGRMRSRHQKGSAKDWQAKLAAGLQACSATGSCCRPNF